MRAKVEPLVFAAEIVRLEVPVLVKVSRTLLVLPAGTLPKLMLAGLGETLPETPHPFSERFKEGSLALLLKVTVPIMR